MRSGGFGILRPASSAGVPPFIAKNGGWTSPRRQQSISGGPSCSKSTVPSPCSYHESTFKLTEDKEPFPALLSSGSREKDWERDTEGMEKQRRACVTGAGGYLASWVVKYLLSKGYIVHGTVRDPADEKNAHLKKLDNASENLQLFKATLLDYDSLRAAVAGCSGVLHVASPCTSNITNPEVDLIEPAVTGTLNVLRACSEAGVQRAVVVSSGSAVTFTPHWPKDKFMDEQCWSDEEYCRTTGRWYALSKTLAEKAALEYGEKSGLSVMTVCPTLIFGPLLQPTVNASSLTLLKILRGEQETMENRGRAMVDVRDVAEALIIAYEKSEASGRYICSPHVIRMSDLVDKLRSMFPHYNYPKNFTETNNVMKLTCEKLKSLGWKYKPLEETLADTVKCFQQAGLLAKV